MDGVNATVKHVVHHESGGFMRFSHSRLLAAAVFSACVALAVALPAFGSPAKAHVTNVKVTVKKSNDFKFVLSKKTVPHGKVTFTFSNQGQLSHDFKLCSSNKGGNGNACAGKVTPMVSPGSSAKLTVTLKKPGKYEYLCTVPGHAAAGMKGTITVR
jgi:uncharacterized cupredoxin-like copper-binding protein